MYLLIELMSEISNHKVKKDNTDISKYQKNHFIYETVKPQRTFYVYIVFFCLTVDFYMYCSIVSSLSCSFDNCSTDSFNVFR